MSRNNCILSFFPQHANIKSDSGRLRATANQNHTGSKLRCHFFAAEPLSVDEEEETSAALGLCSWMQEIIELCKDECNCFWEEWKWAAIQQENETPAMKWFWRDGRTPPVKAPVVEMCDNVGLMKYHKNNRKLPEVKPAAEVCLLTTKKKTTVLALVGASCSWNQLAILIYLKWETRLCNIRLEVTALRWKDQ